MGLTGGDAPPRSQQGLGEILRDEGYFLPCKCVPVETMEVAPLERVTVFNMVESAAVETLSPSVKRVPLDTKASALSTQTRSPAILFILTSHLP